MPSFPVTYMCSSTGRGEDAGTHLSACGPTAAGGAGAEEAGERIPPRADGLGAAGVTWDVFNLHKDVGFETFVLVQEFVL